MSSDPFDGRALAQAFDDGRETMALDLIDYLRMLEEDEPLVVSDFILVVEDMLSWEGDAEE
jgi:hypothetical protein